MLECEMRMTIPVSELLRRVNERILRCVSHLPLVFGRYSHPHRPPFPCLSCKGWFCKCSLQSSRWERVRISSSGAPPTKSEMLGEERNDLSFRYSSGGLPWSRVLAEHPLGEVHMICSLSCAVKYIDSLCLFCEH